MSLITCVIQDIRVCRKLIFARLWTEFSSGRKNIGHEKMKRQKNQYSILLGPVVQKPDSAQPDVSINRSKIGRNLVSRILNYRIPEGMFLFIC